ncbi:hypothetical protein [Shewanella sp.]|uniref:hypothetical protein n=1 Tax=Shewanella sp. TaxID=50422 RepID=UPI001EC18DC4|nr:hypothetical protein [Shewanella sp.]NRB24874.1 hypothetical protein [Shewanella sp.]
MKKVAFALIIVAIICFYKVLPSLYIKSDSEEIVFINGNDKTYIDIDERADSTINTEVVTDVIPAVISHDGVDINTVFFEINSLFKRKDYSRVSEYFNIVNLCNAIPKNHDEFQSDILKHGNDEGFDVEALEFQMKQCSGIPTISYGAQAAIYRDGIENGYEESKLFLALLMPQQSDEKKMWLEMSSLFSDVAIKTLAEYSLDDSNEYGDISRLFWLSTSLEIKVLYPEETYLALLNITNYLDNQMLSTIQDLSNKWINGGRVEKSEVLEKLKYLELSTKS